MTFWGIDPLVKKDGRYVFEGVQGQDRRTFRGVNRVYRQEKPFSQDHFGLRMRKVNIGTCVAVEVTTLLHDALGDNNGANHGSLFWTATLMEEPKGWCRHFSVTGIGVFGRKLKVFRAQCLPALKARFDLPRDRGGAWEQKQPGGRVVGMIDRELLPRRTPQFDLKQRRV